MTPSLGIIGLGAFGEFMLRHLAPYFRISVHDAARDLGAVALSYNVEIGTLESVAASDIVVLAVPVQALESVVRRVATLVKPGALVLDVASVKIRPAEILRLFPEGIDVIGTHPLFGPQSGRLGIVGLNLVLCDLGRDGAGRLECVKRFAEERLGLRVMVTTPERHDRELAYVQGLTHLVARIFQRIDLDGIELTTKTFDTLMESIAFLRHDSDDLFMAIENENPFVRDAKEQFFQAARDIEERLKGHRA